MADPRLQQQSGIGEWFAINSVFSRLIASSWSASTIHTGTVIARSSPAVKWGSVSHILLIWSRKDLYWPGVGDNARYSP
jgi:hypothetical protein